MTFLISMPGGTEWIVIIVMFIFLITMPILAIVFYTRNKELRRQITALTNEKNALLAKLLESK